MTDDEREMPEKQVKEDLFLEGGNYYRLRFGEVINHILEMDLPYVLQDCSLIHHQKKLKTSLTL